MSIRFTNQPINTKGQAVVLVVTHSDPFSTSEALAAAIVESAFGCTTIQRQKEGHQRFIDDPNVITINLVEVSDVERRNIGHKCEKARGGVAYTTASLTWYSFASILLANVGISGEYTSEIIQNVDTDFFLHLDQYHQSSQWWKWPFVNGAGHGREIEKKLRGNLLGDDDLCFRHAMEAAKILLHQVISRAVQEMQSRFEEDPRFVDEKEFRTAAKRPIFLVARPIQCLGQKVFYAREDLEALEEREKPEAAPRDSVPRSEIAKEVEKIIKERFSKSDISDNESPAMRSLTPLEQNITNYAAEKFSDQHGVDPRAIPAALGRIQKAARRVQELLSNGSVNSAEISLRNLVSDYAMEVVITPVVWQQLKSNAS